MQEPSGSVRDWALLLRAPGAGGEALRLALKAAGSATALLRAGRVQWQQWGLQPATCQFLDRDAHLEVDADLAWLASAHATLLPCTDPEFPSGLTAAPDAPPALYVLGDPALLARPQLAIVGSRSPTAAGRRLARQLAGDLAAAGFIITSGMARGIDAAAHEGALAAGGGTIAVLGTGPDQCYPASNAALAQQIARSGALVSEFPPGTAPRAWHFPRRNRIIAALAQATVVVEAAAASGSLITARIALDAGREVFAVPGSPLNPQAAGCLELLREGAVLARDARDILAEFDPQALKKASTDQLVMDASDLDSGAHRLDKDYEMLLDALGFEPASIDDLVDRTGLAPGSVASMMLILELKGRVETRPGALFNRVD